MQGFLRPTFPLLAFTVAGLAIHSAALFCEAQSAEADAQVRERLALALAQAKLELSEAEARVEAPLALRVKAHQQWLMTEQAGIDAWLAWWRESQALQVRGTHLYKLFVALDHRGRAWVAGGAGFEAKPAPISAPSSSPWAVPVVVLGAVLFLGVVVLGGAS